VRAPLARSWFPGAPFGAPAAFLKHLDWPGFR
jgi:hypothetical protein